MKKRVMAAMSGGVDSSVAALLLKGQGYEVVGVTMCLGLGGGEEKTGCCGGEAIGDARRACDVLAIPHYVMDFSRDMEQEVIGRFRREYLRGRTPNPCIDCNRYLKFGNLLEKAGALGFDFIATGHYAKIAREGDEFYLKKPRDEKKDQTYFLYAIPKDSLKQIIFPLAPYLKSEVRELARRARLPSAQKRESQDICFGGVEGMKRLFAGDPSVRPGEIRDETGRVVGEHRGIAFYTIGQRTGLGVSHPRPLYVLAIDPQNNRLIVGEKGRLFKQRLRAGDLNILVKNWPGKVGAKIRYRKKEAPGLAVRKDGTLEIHFEEPQEAITPGQAVVCYQDDLVLGGGVIEEGIDGYCRED